MRRARSGSGAATWIARSRMERVPKPPKPGSRGLAKAWTPARSSNIAATGSFGAVASRTIGSGSAGAAPPARPRFAPSANPP